MGRCCWELLNMDGFIDPVGVRVALKVVRASKALARGIDAVTSLGD